MMKEEGGLMITGDIIEGLIEAEMKGVGVVLLYTYSHKNENFKKLFRY